MPVALTIPVSILALTMLAEAMIFAAEEILPVAVTVLALTIFPDTVPDVDTCPEVNKLPTTALPVTLRLVNVPTLSAITPVN